MIAARASPRNKKIRAKVVLCPDHPFGTSSPADSDLGCVTLDRCKDVEGRGHGVDFAAFAAPTPFLWSGAKNHARFGLLAATLIA